MVLENDHSCKKIKAGFVLIDKPSGITSHDVIDQLRRITKIQKIGHAGTLDPLATGLLIVGIGREATKKLSQFEKMDKEYIAVIKLGAVSNTFDKEGKIEKKRMKRILTKNEVEEVLKSFLGNIKQLPPLFSAKKIKGKKAYEWAKKGIKIKLKPIEVEIKKIEILNYSFPYLKIKVNCSTGTYIRSLANDIGKKLGCGGYIEELRRTKIGDISVEKAIKLEKIISNHFKKELQGSGER